MNRCNTLTHTLLANYVTLTHWECVPYVIWCKSADYDLLKTNTWSNTETQTVSEHFSLSLSLSVSPCIHLSFCHSVCLPFFLSLYLSLPISVCPPPSLLLSVCLSFFLSISLSVSLTSSRFCSSCVSVSTDILQLLLHWTVRAPHRHPKHTHRSTLLTVRNVITHNNIHYSFNCLSYNNVIRL